MRRLLPGQDPAALALAPGTAVELVSPSDLLPDPQTYWLGGQLFELREEYRLWDAERLIIIPARFRFNGASVPRPGWAIISPLDCGRVAVLVHDYLYSVGGQIGGGQRPYTRLEADRLFVRHMKLERVPAWRRKMAYPAVRIAGRGNWKG